MRLAGPVKYTPPLSLGQVKSLGRMIFWLINRITSESAIGDGVERSGVRAAEPRFLPPAAGLAARAQLLRQERFQGVIAQRTRRQIAVLAQIIQKAAAIQRLAGTAPTSPKLSGNSGKRQFRTVDGNVIVRAQMEVAYSLFTRQKLPFPN